MGRNGNKKAFGGYGNGKAPKKNYFKPKKVKKKENLKRCVELNSCCMCCGDSNNVSAHHIIFRSKRGDDSLENLITLCFKCHRKAHDGFYRDKVFVSPKEFMINLLETLNVDEYKKVIDKLKGKFYEI